MIKIIFIVLFGILSPNIHAQTTLIGHWHFISIKEANYFNSSSPQSKDLILNSDSTFIIIGDTTIHDTVPGWHVGGKMEGKWKYIQSNKRKTLRLYLNPIQDNFFIDYHITKLSSNAFNLKLVGKISYTIKYRR